MTTFLKCKDFSGATSKKFCLTTALLGPDEKDLYAVVTHENHILAAAVPLDNYSSPTLVEIHHIENPKDSKTWVRLLSMTIDDHFGDTPAVMRVYDTAENPHIIGYVRKKPGQNIAYTHGLADPKKMLKASDSNDVTQTHEFDGVFVLWWHAAALAGAAYYYANFRHMFQKKAQETS